MFKKLAIIIATFVGLSAISTAHAVEFCERPSHPSRAAFCAIGETVTDFYTGKKIACDNVDADHVVSIGEARKMGMSCDAIKRLARDPDNLVLTDSSLNRSKGARTLEEFIGDDRVTNKTDYFKRANKIRARYGMKRAGSVVLKRALVTGGTYAAKRFSTVAGTRIATYVATRGATLAAAGVAGATTPAVGWGVFIITTGWTVAEIISLKNQFTDEEWAAIVELAEIEYAEFRGKTTEIPLGETTFNAHELNNMFANNPDRFVDYVQTLDDTAQIETIERVTEFAAQTDGWA